MTRALPYFSIPLLVIAAVRHWTETPSETIWRVRYTNCDKGYFVELPSGIVAHAAHSPAPNHGFLISTSGTGTTDRVTAEQTGFVGVFDQYNSMELRDPQAYLDWGLKNTPGSELVYTRQMALRGLPAIQAEYSAVERGRRIWNKVLIVFRDKDDIIYELMLRTLKRDDANDMRLYQVIKSGFHVFPISQGECVNP